MLEATAPISQIQEDIIELKEQGDRSELRLDTWEEYIKLIPIIFEEVGLVKQDLEILKEKNKHLTNKIV